MIEMLLLTTLFLAMAVFAWFRFSDAIALFLFLLPTYQLRYTVAGIPSNALEILFGALVVVWFAQRIRHGGKPLRLMPILFPSLLLLAVAAGSLLISPDRHAGLGDLKAYFLEPIMFFLILWDRVSGTKAYQKMLLALGCGVLIVTAVAFLQYAHVLTSPLPWDAETPRRVVGLFEYPNAVGLYVSPIAALFSALLLLSTTRQKRAWQVFAGCVVLASILATFFSVSRGALVAIVASVLFTSLFSVYRKWAVTIFVLASVLVLAIPQTRGMVARIATGTDVSTDVRTVLWQGTVKLLKARPLQGAGLGGFPIVYNEYRLAKHTELLLYPHNIVLNFWVELGLAGLVVMIWIFVLAFRQGKQLLSHPDTVVRLISVGCLASLVSVVVYGLVDVPYFKNDLAMLFWFVLALLFLAPQFGEKAGQNG